jgi:hypothetical protein
MVTTPPAANAVDVGRPYRGGNDGGREVDSTWRQGGYRRRDPPRIPAHSFAVFLERSVTGKNEGGLSAPVCYGRPGSYLA